MSRSQKVTAESSTVLQIAGKIARRDATWTQEEVDDASLWIKASLGLVIGIVWGAIPLQGATAAAFGVGSGAVLASLFIRNYLGIHEDAFGGALEILQQGAAPSIFTFLARIRAAIAALTPQ